MEAEIQRVRFLRTRYPHWGSHTAFNALWPHLGPTIRAQVREVPLRRGSSSAIERLLFLCLNRQGLQEYGAADLGAEMGLLMSTVLSRTDVIVFLDAEHSMLFSPRWFRRLSWIRRPPKIVAMFHQPPAVLETIISTHVVRQADHVVTVAPEQAEYFSRFLPPERVSTIPLGVDTGYFVPPRGERGEGKFLCLSGGVWLRDYDAVFRTAELLRGVPGIEFHIVASHLGVPAGVDNVVIHRDISDAALLRLYQDCHVLFLPLRDSTANTFLMEGSACGLPIVSSDLASLKTYFPGGEAILVRGNHPPAFADALLGLYRDPGRRAAMSALARRRALEFSWERIAPQYERLFRKLTAG